MNEITMYTVYDHPKDYPDSWVLRGWVVGPGIEPEEIPLLYVSDYEDIRFEMEQRGLTCILRKPEDDPCIKETWI